MFTRIILLACLLILSACSPAAVVTPTALPPTQEPSPTDSPTDTPTATSTELPTITDTPLPTETATKTLDPMLAVMIYGSNLMQTRCNVCHSTERITNKRASLDAWTGTVDRMIGKGAVLNATERQNLIDFLSISFP